MEHSKILKGDIITTFGSKVKLTSLEDQDTSKKMYGLNAKDKLVGFRYDDIQSIIRHGKLIYHAME